MENSIDSTLVKKTKRYNIKRKHVPFRKPHNKLGKSIHTEVEKNDTVQSRRVADRSSNVARH